MEGCITTKCIGIQSHREWQQIWGAIKSFARIDRLLYSKYGLFGTGTERIYFFILMFREQYGATVHHTGSVENRGADRYISLYQVKYGRSVSWVATR